MQLYGFSEAHLRRNIRPTDRQRPGFAAAAFGFINFNPHQFIDGFQRILLLHWGMTRVVIQILGTVDTIQFNAFFQQIFVDIDYTAPREDLVELVVHQLIKTCTATDHDGFDIQIVQGIGYPMKQDTVIGRDFLRFFELTSSSLRETATQIAGRQRSEPQPGK